MQHSLEGYCKYYIRSLACHTFVRAFAWAGLEPPSGQTRYDLTSATGRRLSETLKVSVTNSDARVEPCSVLLDVLSFGAKTKLKLDLSDDKAFAEHLEGK